jgi:hypothetical protein
MFYFYPAIFKFNYISPNIVNPDPFADCNVFKGIRYFKSIVYSFIY